MTLPKTARALALIGIAATTAAQADTATDQSCRLLGVLGGNRTGDIAPALADIAARWPEPNRAAAVERMTGLLGQIAFAGGNVYEIGRLGEDLVEHLVVLRLADGETAGMRLSYEWTPEGLSLTTLDLKLDYMTELGLTIPVRAEPLACP